MSKSNPVALLHQSRKKNSQVLSLNSSPWRERLLLPFYWLYMPTGSWWSARMLLIGAFRAISCSTKKSLKGFYLSNEDFSPRHSNKCLLNLRRLHNTIFQPKQVCKKTFFTTSKELVVKNIRNILPV